MEVESEASGDFFYRSQRTCRTGRHLVFLLLFLLIGGIAGSFLYLDWIDKQPMNFLYLSAACGCGLIFLVGLARFIRNPVERVELNTQGVIDGARQWAWENVIRVSAARESFSKIVRIQIHTGSPGRAPGLWVLETDHPLDNQEYACVTVKLKQYLQFQHPHVQVDD